MRVYLYILLGFMAWGCHTQPKSNHTAHLNPDVMVDTIIFKYAFSMDEDAFMQHTKQLLKDGVMHMEGQTVVFPFAGHTASFSPSYTDGKLSELGISLKGALPRFMQVNAYGKITKIYWNPDGWSESPGYLKGSTTFRYKEGNLEIVLQEGMNDARIFYRNLAAWKDSVAPNVSHSPI